MIAPAGGVSCPSVPGIVADHHTSWAGGQVTCPLGPGQQSRAAVLLVEAGNRGVGTHLFFMVFELEKEEQNCEFDESSLPNQGINA